MRRRRARGLAGEVVGPFFVTDPDEMFSLDRFHPAPGLPGAAATIAPSYAAFAATGIA